MGEPFRRMHVIYSDDLRYEIGGKLSYIGVYAAEMLCQSFPITLPKLAVSAIVTTDIDQPFEWLTFRAFLENEGGEQTVLAEANIPHEALAAQHTEERPALRFRPLKTITAAINFEFPGLTLMERQVLRVCAECESGTIWGPGLTIAVSD